MYSLPSTSHTCAAPGGDHRRHVLRVLVLTLGVGVRAARDDVVQPGVGLDDLADLVNDLVVVMSASQWPGRVRERLVLLGHQGWPAAARRLRDPGRRAIDTSSLGSCARSIRYETSAGSVSAWKPWAQPAGT